MLNSIGESFFYLKLSDNVVYSGFCSSIAWCLLNSLHKLGLGYGIVYLNFLTHDHFCVRHNKWLAISLLIDPFYPSDNGKRACVFDLLVQLYRMQL